MNKSQLPARGSCMWASSTFILTSETTSTSSSVAGKQSMKFVSNASNRQSGSKRKPIRLNERYVPELLCNGDTHIKLLTRSRFLLMKSRDKWSESQKKHGELLFKIYLQIEEAYNLINSLRCVFRNNKLDKQSARQKLHEWYQKVSASTLRKVKSARDTIKSRQDEVQNYFLNFSTNASAESLNAKIKSFRAQLHGVSDLPFFMYRLGGIFGQPCHGTMQRPRFHSKMNKTTPKSSLGNN